MSEDEANKDAEPQVSACLELAGGAGVLLRNPSAPLPQRQPTRRGSTQLAAAGPRV